MSEGGIILSMYELAYSLNYALSPWRDGAVLKADDVTEGGANNRTGLTACGTGNVGDSLMAIKSFALTIRPSPWEMYDAL